MVLFLRRGLRPPRSLLLSIGILWISPNALATSPELIHNKPLDALYADRCDVSSAAHQCVSIKAKGLAIGITGEAHTALEFDGGADGITLADPSSYTADQFTLAFWFNESPTVNPSSKLFSAVTSGAAAGYYISRSGTDLTLHYHTGATPTWRSLAATGVAQDTWNHVAVRFAVGSHIELLINGSVIASDTNDITALASSLNSATLACGESCGSDFFRGSLADLQLWNTSLSPAQIAGLHAYPQKTHDVVQRFSFDTRVPSECNKIASAAQCQHVQVQQLTLDELGENNGATSLDGIDDHVITEWSDMSFAGNPSAAGDFSFGITFSFSNHVFPEGSGGEAVLLAKGDTSQNPFKLAINSEHQIVLSFYNGTNRTITSTSTVTSNNWSHIGVQYDSIAQTLSLAFNGTIEQSITLDTPEHGPNSLIDNTSPMVFGCQLEPSGSCAANSFFKGTFSRALFYAGRGLSLEQLVLPTGDESIIRQVVGSDQADCIYPK